MAGGTNIRPTPFGTVGAAHKFQKNHELRTDTELRVLWFYREGELITRSRMWQIRRKAEEKLAAGLADLREELCA